MNSTYSFLAVICFNTGESIVIFIFKEAAWPITSIKVRMRGGVDAFSFFIETKNKSLT